PFERGGDVSRRPVGLRDCSEPELPQPAVRDGGGQGLLMIRGQRLQPYPVALEGDRRRLDHRRPRRDRNSSPRNSCPSLPSNGSLTRIGISVNWRFIRRFKAAAPPEPAPQPTSPPESPRSRRDPATGRSTRPGAGAHRTP